MLVFTLLSILPAICYAAPTVDLRGAIISGRKLEFSDQEFFGGIPYAETPIGELRFRPPQIKLDLNATFNASDFGPACLQPFAEPGSYLSENCLTLNIQRPAGTNSSSTYPVMIWIHGGGFLFGASSSPQFNATTLISRSITRGTPIIYVNMNYRLGPLGFAQGLEAIQSNILNIGLKDQLAALQWVQKNIAAFGGDPRKVTLFGESAGAASIAIHQLNPDLAYLARGVILQSAAASSHRPELHENDWQQFVKAAGCGSENVTSKSLPCLQSANSSTLLKAIVSVSSWDDPLQFLPAIDGPGGLIPDSPTRILTKGDFTRLPVLAGLNLDEGTMFPPEGINTTAEIKNFLIESYSASGSGHDALESVVDQLLELYPDIPALGSPYDTGNETFGLSSQFKRMSALLGDLMVAAPVRMQMNALAQANVEMYGYYFTERQSSTPAHMGVAHSYDIEYVHGHPKSPVSDSSKRLTGLMMDYWLSFATSLHPNDGLGYERMKWTPYTPESPMLLQLNGDDMRFIDGNFRSKQIDFIQANAITLGY